jgi:ring-1,2-phenylacetyl-CoA epoxidase subunit PaaC
MHANEWIKQLGNADEETVARMQKQLDYALPYALGVFEPSKFEEILISDEIFSGEIALQSVWEDEIAGIIAETKLVLPSLQSLESAYGGRYGRHTEHLQPLLTEMGEVIQSDPNAEW